jgi:hypothetical protein
MGFIRILVLVCAFAVVGCTSESQSVTPPPAPTASQSAKAALQDIAASGELGSATMGLRESLEGFDEGKALLPDLDALEAMSDAAAIKAKAKEMAGKL